MKEALKYLKGDFPNVHETYHPYVDENVYEGSMEFIKKALFIAYTEGLFSSPYLNYSSVQIGRHEFVKLIHIPTGELVEYTAASYESKFQKREESNRILKTKLINRIKNKTKLSKKEQEVEAQKLMDEILNNKEVKAKLDKAFEDAIFYGETYIKI